MTQKGYNSPALVHTGELITIGSSMRRLKSARSSLELVGAADGDATGLDARLGVRCSQHCAWGLLVLCENQFCAGIPDDLPQSAQLWQLL